MEKTTKRRRGDRKDGVLLRNLDGMHFITPIIYPNRCDNEAYISETIDLTNMNAYLQKKNAQSADFPYTMFHIIVAALIKTITLRPKMNHRQQELLSEKRRVGVIRRQEAVRRRSGGGACRGAWKR